MATDTTFGDMLNEDVGAVVTKKKKQSTRGSVWHSLDKLSNEEPSREIRDEGQMTLKNIKVDHARPKKY